MTDTPSSRSSTATGPQALAATLGPWDAVAMIVGIVVGTGIFRLPSFVAGNVDSANAFLLLWVAGGVASFIGALVYAELVSSFPSAGGDYHFLMRAYGRPIAFLFAWARMTVMQTGSIALVSLVFGDYFTQLLPLGAYSSAIYAAAAIVVLTTLNVVGTWQGKTAQNLLTIAIVVAMVTAFVAAVAHPGVAPSASTGTLSIGGAMILVLLTYGGWNEAAYLSGEIKDVRRNMVRALMIGIGVVTLLYVAINYAYVRVLGLDGLRSSEAIGADLMRATLGDAGAVVLIVLVVAAALSTVNATIFTGARTNFALGRDFALFRVLGSWKRDGETPANALLLQAVIALALVGGASVTRSGIQTMVDYTAPVFWLFFLLTGISLFILRGRTPEAAQPFRVPLYPITPLLFCAICAYMLYSSVTFTGMGAAYGIAIVLAGLPVLAVAMKKG